MESVGLNHESLLIYLPGSVIHKAKNHEPLGINLYSCGSDHNLTLKKFMGEGFFIFHLINSIVDWSCFEILFWLKDSYFLKKKKSLSLELMWE